MGIIGEFHTVAPVRPLAGYVGGKKQLAKRLIAQIEGTPHSLYAEAFVGMGGVFFRRRSAPKTEVINDASRDIATFFRILQRHHQAFHDMLKWQVTSRAEFERLTATPPETLTDLERSARFLYLQRLAFGGKVAGRNFGISTTGSAKFDMTKIAPMLQEAHERLAGVTIECLSWRDFIARWDRPGALFFLDPPYWGSEDYYGKAMFPRADHEALASALIGLKGQFILTMSDRPETRSIYGRAGLVESIGLTYSVAGADNQVAAREIIVSGPIPDARRRRRPPLPRSTDRGGEQGYDK